jgi:WD40 repeat protein
MYFSNDERFLLVVGSNDAMSVWRVLDGTLVLSDTLPERKAYAFSPDGRLLAIGRQDSVITFDLATGQEVTRFRVRSVVASLAFHPNNRHLAAGYGRVNVACVYDVETGDQIAELPVGEMLSQTVAWHPHGTRLAIAGSDPRIQIWDVAGERRVATLEGHVQMVGALTFQPDGQLLASHGWDGQLLLWDVAEN